MHFEECIQQMFKSKNATINGISRLSGINKGTLHRIINGKQEVRFDEMMRISTALGLTFGEEELLFNAYFDEVYGARTMEAVHLAVSDLRSAFSNASDSIPEKSLDSYPEGGFLPNMRTVEESIVFVTEIDEGKIYTNFPFRNRRLDDFFFKKASTQKLELIHFVEKIQNNGEISNLHSLIRSLRFMNIGQFPYILDIWQTGSESQLLPYFVATEKGMVLFGDTCGFISMEARAINRMLDTLREMASSAKRLGEKPKNIMEIRNLVAGVDTTDLGIINLCKYPCLAANITREMMYDAANDIPDKDMLIDLCATHYSNLLAAKKHVQFVSVDGLEHFAKTGNFYEIPPEYVHEFSPEVRIELLEKAKEDILAGRLYILNTQYGVPDGIIIETYADCTIISGSDTSRKNFGIGMGFFYCARDAFYVRLMRVIRDYLISGRCVFSPDTALRIIESCISIARNSDKTTT